jgi:hypothetical protein
LQTIKRARGRGAEVGLEEALGGQALHGHVSPSKDIQLERSPCSSSSQHGTLQVAEGLFGALIRVIRERDPKQPVRLTQGVQFVASCLVVCVEGRVHGRRDVTVEVHQLGLRNGLRREASSEASAEGRGDFRPIHLWVHHHDLGVVRKGQGGRGRLAMGQSEAGDPPL